MSIPNYTEAQVKELQKQEITLAIARQFATNWNKSVKSIIAKAVSLGVYKAEQRVKARTRKISKADLVKAIAKATDAESLHGLEKAPTVALNNLLKAIS